MEQLNRFLDQFLTPAVKQIVILNVVVFLAVNIGMAVGIDLVSPLLLLQFPWFIRQPWGVLSYMFLHTGLLHLVFNMLLLWFIGPFLENRWGTKKFWQFYLITGVGAGLLNVLINSILHVERGAVLGASGAIYGIALAFAAYNPTATFLFFFVVPMQARIMILLMAVFALFGILSPGPGGVSHLTHLLGFVVGYVWLALYHRDWDFKTWRWR